MRRVLGLGWRFLTVSLINSLSLLAAILLTPGISIDNTPANVGMAVFFALLIGLANAFVRPVLVYLTHPVNLLTIGIPTVLIDSAFILLMARTWTGFHVDAPWPSAAIGAVILPTANIILHTLTDPKRQRTLYDWVLRRLGRSSSTAHGTQAGRGVVFVQVDGLSYVDLRSALRNGVMPTVQELLAVGEHHMLAWDCGMPSQTSSVQAGIMYGDNYDIPAFRWFDREAGRVFVSNRPDAARIIDGRFRGHRRGLLSDGSSVSNLIMGEARTGILTVSDIGDGRPSGRIEDLLLFMFNPYCLLRVAGLMMWDLIAEWAAAWRQRLRKDELQVSRRGLYPVLRVISNILLREISTYMVLLDIMRGVPAVYVTYMGYDEVAHFAGPHSTDTREPLAGIDNQIRHIEKIIRRDAPIPYDLVILSDHGQTSSTPFAQAAGVRLPELVSELVTGDLAVSDEAESPELPGPLLALLEELRYAERAQKRRRLAPLAIERGRRVLERYGEIEPSARAGRGAELPTAPAEPSGETPDVLVLCSGSAAHLYFDRQSTPWSLEQIEQRHPLLVTQLAQHAEIGFVAGRSELRGPLVIGAEGFRQLRSGVVVGVDPLAVFGDPDLTAAQVLRVVSFPNAGDLLVHGSYRDGRVVTFESHVGSHGGLGGAQGLPFLIYPAKMEIDPAQITNATDLYPFLLTLRDGE